MVIFQPRKVLDRIAPKALVKRLVTRDLTLNRTVSTLLARFGVVSKKTLEKIAAKVIRQYEEAFAKRLAEGLSEAEALEETLAGKALMVQRVQGAVVQEIAEDLKAKYRGERYVWLPSTAEEPDPLHQLNYGKRFTIGKGEMPGDRFGCQCGMKILVNDDELEL